jgi:2-polyprenyl-3-methyl-5-hydroxy-6-metoxy-1,4-benzoquinol methylase
MNDQSSGQSFSEQSRAAYRNLLVRLKKAKLLNPEIITETIEIETDKSWPALMASREDMTSDEAAQLRTEVEHLKPWNYSIYLGQGIYTGQPKFSERMVFRAKLLTGAVQQLTDVRGASVIDLACNHGYFGLELANLGASVYGIDLREANVRKAQLLARHFKIPNARYEQRNVYDVTGEYDIVYNLGLLYHVTDPYRLIANTFRMTRKMAVVDTLTHVLPISAFIQTVDHDVSLPGEGEFQVEVHPTYRAVVDLLWAAGFKRVIEARSKGGPNSAAHIRYRDFHRRCFIAFK